MLVLAGCGEEASTQSSYGVCGTLAEVPFAPGDHVEPGTPIDFDTNPPVTGTHYRVWAAWGRTYGEPPIDRGYYVHNAEHGGMVFLYNCPDGCAADVATLESFVAGLPVDPRCVPPLRTRTIIASDPRLPEGVRFAAVAWGTSYSASCLDLASLRSFYDSYYGRGPENTCAQGVEPE